MYGNPQRRSASAQSSAVTLFGVQMKDAITWVLGLTTTTHMVIRSKVDSTKPPLRAPPHRKWGFWQ